MGGRRNEPQAAPAFQHCTDVPIRLIIKELRLIDHHDHSLFLALEVVARYQPRYVEVVRPLRFPRRHQYQEFLPHPGASPGVGKRRREPCPEVHSALIQVTEPVTRWGAHCTAALVFPLPGGPSSMVMELPVTPSLNRLRVCGRGSRLGPIGGT